MPVTMRILIVIIVIISIMIIVIIIVIYDQPGHMNSSGREYFSWLYSLDLNAVTANVASLATHERHDDG